MTLKYFITVGHEGTGFKHIGPFDSESEAEEEIRKMPPNLDDGSACIFELHAPEFVVPQSVQDAYDQEASDCERHKDGYQ